MLILESIDFKYTIPLPVWWPTLNRSIIYFVPLWSADVSWLNYWVVDNVTFNLYSRIRLLADVKKNWARSNFKFGKVDEKDTCELCLNSEENVHLKVILNVGIKDKRYNNLCNKK